MRHHTVIRLDRLQAALQTGQPLPRRPVLITFDDGYRDVAGEAAPILADAGVPAALFVTSGWLDHTTAFVWDLAAELFRATSRTSASLPLLGDAAWPNPQAGQDVEDRWIGLAKRLAPNDRAASVDQLADALEVSLDRVSLDSLRLGWEDLRRLHRTGWSIGGHTETHSILTSLDDTVAERELRGSKTRIEAEIGAPVRTFAYPNGDSHDFADRHHRMLHEAGYELAFTLQPGPTRLATAARSPYAIRRISVTRHDSMLRFVAKLAGAQRLIRPARPGPRRRPDAAFR